MHSAISHASRRPPDVILRTSFTRPSTALGDRRPGNEASPYLSIYIPGLIPRRLPECIHASSHSQTPTWVYTCLVSFPDPYLSIYIPCLIPRPLPEYIHTLPHSQTPTWVYTYLVSFPDTYLSVYIPRLSKILQYSFAQTESITSPDVHLTSFYVGILPGLPIPNIVSFPVPRSWMQLELSLYVEWHQWVRWLRGNSVWLVIGSSQVQSPAALL